MRRVPTVTTLDLVAIDDVFEMGSGYVLNFSDHTFRHFFADLGIDIDTTIASKAKRLRAFLREAEPEQAARTLEALLEYRGVKDGDDSSVNLVKGKNLISSLRKGAVAMLPSPHQDVLSLEYVHELESKIEQRLAEADLDGAITVARTLLEAVLVELERQLAETPGDYKGDLPKQYQMVAKRLRIDDKRSDLDENFKQVARGLVQVVHGLAPIRNKMSDGHPRERKPEPHHARVVVNAAKTVAIFLIESYRIQRERGLLPGTPR